MTSARVQPNARAAAARILAQWLRSGRFAERLIEDDVPDRSFVMEVVYGVVKQKRRLEWVVARCVPGRPDAASKPYLLVGLYQLLLMDTVAPYAAVNETVAAVKEGPARRAAGFVNAVLRRVVREQADITAELAGQPLAIRESHPDELVTRWTERLGGERAAALCRWNNERPAVVVRPCPTRVDFDAYRAALREAGIDAAPHAAAPRECLVIAHGTPVAALPGYREGHFVVQDPSTLKAVELLAPQPGEHVLDACAAPGGKTLLLAEHMAGQGRIVATDRDAARVALISQNLRRVRAAGVEAVEADMSRPDNVRRVAGDAPFDRILLDVPCTNTGVLRRRPDARWRFSQQRLAHLVQVQRALLDSTSRCLKVGGTLVYSTCSIEPEEGKQLVRGWLRSNPGFRRVAAVSQVPPASGADGIYAAALTRVATSPAGR